MNLVGQIFDQRYEILDLLGSGGLATVYKAQQMEIGRIVALKILHARFSNDSEFKARFLREAQTLNKLSHPNIVSIYHIGCADDGTLYIVMEMAEGQSLAQLLNDVDRLETLLALDYIKTLGIALSYIHKNGVVHRDLKASNIIICNDGERITPKLIDFGLSKVEFQAQRLTATGELIGTPDYMSPEQCRGQQIDASSDIYSLTVCLFEAITGRKPYAADTAVGIIFQHMNESIPVIKPPDVQQFHPKLNELIAKGMAKRPADRFASMDEMVDAITLVYREMKERPHTGGNTPKRQKMIMALITSGLLIIAGLSYVGIERSKLSIKTPSTKYNTTTIPLSVSALLDYNSTPSTPALVRDLSACRAYYQLAQKGSPVPQSVKIRAQRYFATMLSQSCLPATSFRLCQKLLKDYRKLNMGATAEGNPAMDYNYIAIMTASTLIDFGKPVDARKILHDLCNSKNLSIMNKAGLYREFLKLGEVKTVRDSRRKADNTRDLAELSMAFRAFGYDQDSIECGIKAAEGHLQPSDFEYAYTLENRASSYFLAGKAKLAYADALHLWQINDDLATRRYRLDSYLASLARLFAMLGDYDHAISALCKIYQIKEPTEKPSSKTKEQILSLIRNQGERTIPLLAKDALHSQLSPQEKCEILYEAGKQYWPYRPLFDAIAFDILKKSPESAIDKKMHARFLHLVAVDLDNANYKNLAVKYYDELLNYIKKYGFIDDDDDPQLSFRQDHESQVRVLRMLAILSKTSSSEAHKLLTDVLSKKGWQNSSPEILQIAYWFRFNDVIEKVIANQDTAASALVAAKVGIRRNDLKTVRSLLDKARQFLNQNPDHDLEIQYNIMEACYHIEKNDLPESKKYLLAVQPMHIELIKEANLRDELCRTYAICLMLVGLDEQRREFTSQLCKLEGFQTYSKWIIW